MPQEPITILQDRRILLGVTGSIAVYKAVDLASKLTQAGALVDVIMTEAARRFVAPITFQAVTGRPVHTSMWQASDDDLPTHIAHVGLGEGADLFVVAPITANTIAKMAAGLADDLLSVTALAVRCPVLIAPAMDGGMYAHPATQANLDTLQQRGVIVVAPEIGRFASGLVGKGRFPETPTLMGHIRRALGQAGALQGQKVIVTAGGTRESLDPVRYLTNHSTGKQGYALAQAALDAGADVTLISTTTALPAPIGAQLIPVNTASDMLAAVLTHSAAADALLMAAAVADFRPATVAEQKIKKTGDATTGHTLSLARTADILAEVKQARQQGNNQLKVVVGFAAESENLLDNARTKLEKKGLDLIAANDITAPDAGFAASTNRVTLLTKDGQQEALDLLTKAQVSEIIIARVGSLLS